MIKEWGSSYIGKIITQKTYVVEGRQFRTEADYRRAVHDQAIINALRKEAKNSNLSQLRQIKTNLKNGKYKFLTMLGKDFEEEIDQMIANGGKSKASAGKASQSESTKNKNTKKAKAGENQPKTQKEKEEAAINRSVQEELKKREKRRKRLIFFCSIMAIGCLGYYGVYSYFQYKTASTYEALSELKEKPVIAQKEDKVVINYTSNEPVQKEVLDEYKNLLNKNKKLIGWVKIDDTNIDYPVMQTTDNEYYLDHNLNQEYDKNGSIFMDKDCDVLKPSTNFILYGHHMKNGAMFGNLHLYGTKSYYEKHPYIQFDTIYEKGTYEVMYVFRSRVYNEEDIVFKYYQFIDAVSEQEFNSYMKEMAAMSFYDTGVTAQYGDQLLTLSTCDYQEEDGRFVVVAKKITAKE